MLSQKGAILKKVNSFVRIRKICDGKYAEERLGKDGEEKKQKTHCLRTIEPLFVLSNQSVILNIFLNLFPTNVMAVIFIFLITLKLLAANHSIKI